MGREKHCRQRRSLRERQPPRDREQLIARHDHVRRIPAETRDRDDPRPRPHIAHPRPDCHHRARHLEPRRDGPPHVLARRLVQAHANDAVGVVDADGGALDHDLALARRGIGRALDLESMVASGAVDDDVAHGPGSLYCDARRDVEVRSSGGPAHRRRDAPAVETARPAPRPARRCPSASLPCPWSPRRWRVAAAAGPSRAPRAPQDASEGHIRSPDAAPAAHVLRLTRGACGLLAASRMLRTLCWSSAPLRMAPCRSP